MIKRIAPFSSLLILSIGLGFAQATPPDAINYQGVLRDPADKPLNGTYAMVFRFFSADTGGDAVLDGDGCHKWTSLYDERGNWIEYVCFGIDGELVLDQDR